MGDRWGTLAKLQFSKKKFGGSLEGALSQKKHPDKPNTANTGLQQQKWRQRCSR